MKANKAKYYIKTFGCQANIADSHLVSSILEAIGVQKAKTMTDADVLVVNTCSVRQKSEDKVYGIAKKLKGRPKPFVIMSGCMVGSAVGERKRFELSVLQKKTPWVDLYLDPSRIKDLPELLLERGIGIETPNIWEVAQEHFLKKIYEDFAIVNISYGCDNFCSYCVVPYSRGEEVSRSREDIIREVQGFLIEEHGKLLLCGQNVNSWGLSKDEKAKVRIGSTQKLPFAQLLREVHDLEGVKEISFLSSNPFDFTTDLVDAVALPKISNYIHIAAQSGNNDVLKRMNRRHTVEEFIKLIDLLKQAKSRLELGTDIIVGFPGETEDQFMDTVRLFQKVKFNVAFISMYSERLGTFAQKNYEDDVTLAEKKRRHAYLTKVWKESLGA
ncbi:MAG: MiaB/RimO family radical SAM methylthiotransferase [Patescibacteria group bacterium]|jgi:tRNA-2-methylthio-N6-dimethylallyladenosine synthase